MSIHSSLLLAACLLFAVAARAEDAPQLPLAVSDMVYKGLVGKALDAVPMDPEERAALQRTSAVVSGTFTGRSVAVWAGLANPIFLVVGLVWGLFSASNIRTPDASAQPETSRVEPREPIEVAVLPALALSGPAEAIAEAAR